MPNQDGCLYDLEDADLYVEGSYRIDTKGYACRNYGRCPALHSIIAYRAFGAPTPEQTEIDHKDNNPLNNKRDNLRWCTSIQNNMNRGTSSTSTSSFKGVVWHKNKNKWQAQITIERKYYFLGNFTNELEAAYAYNEAAKQFHGEFAKLNELPADFVSIPQSKKRRR